MLMGYDGYNNIMTGRTVNRITWTPQRAQPSPKLCHNGNPQLQQEDYCRLTRLQIISNLPDHIAPFPGSTGIHCLCQLGQDAYSSKATLIVAGR